MCFEYKIKYPITLKIHINICIHYLKYETLYILRIILYIYFKYLCGTSRGWISLQSADKIYISKSNKNEMRIVLFLPSESFSLLKFVGIRRNQ